MGRVVIGYDADRRKVWSDNVPSRARVPWTQRGSVGGSYAIQERKPEGGHTPESYIKGVETRRRLRGEALEP